MTLQPRWSLRGLFAITTILAIFFGIINYMKADLYDTITLAAIMTFILTVFFERRMPQSVSLIIAAICLAWILFPRVQ